MNRRMIIRTLGQIMLAEAILMLPSVFVGVLYRERETLAFLPVIAGLALLGMLGLLIKTKSRLIFAKEGYVIVALAWILLSVFGAIPFRLSGRFGNYWNCFFEIASGFTTTGASILNKIDDLPRCMLFWRSFSHWVGGMGVLVFVLAVMPKSEERVLHLMRAEVPGPVVGKLVPSIRATANILYGVYSGMTILLVILLLCGKMPLFDALCYAFGTAGTGGFGITNAGLAVYNSAYIEIVVAVFMMLFGINFNLYYFILIKKFKDALKSEELHVYLVVIGASVLAICLNTYHLYQNLGESLRYSFFQVTTIISTTGFATADFANEWPAFSQMILVLLMFSGACAGSTGGGMKVSRLILLVKSGVQEIRKTMHPRAIPVVHLEKKPASETMLKTTLVFFVMYISILTASTVVLSLEEPDLTTNFTASLACLSNIGPGLGKVGPAGNYDFYSNGAKVMLALEMLMGRLELFPIFILFATPVYEIKNRMA